MSSADYIRDLEAHEGCIPWLYCDTRGFVTIGIGNLVPGPGSCADLPLCHGEAGAPATMEEKQRAWAMVNDAFRPNLTAHAYEHISDLRLLEDDCRALAQGRLKHEFLPGIRRLLPEFDGYPLGARRALVDIAWNVGLRGLAGFHHMLTSCQRRDWKRAAEECHRATCRDERNAWARERFLEAAGGQS